jgi:hypothetical protein
MARSLLPILYVGLAVLLIAIGFLGGRKWGSRIAWSAAFLAIGSAIVYTAIGPIYRSVAEPLIREKLVRVASEADPVSALFIEKSREVIPIAAREFLSGMESTALTFLIAGVAALSLSLLWARVSAALFSRRRR